jgi:hypothetical protein
MTYEQRTLKVSELRGSDYNPRQISANDYDALKDSISKFGIAEPLVVNSHESRNGIVIGGHQRLRACIDLGEKEVPCFLVSLEEEDERELNIRLNRNHGEFDFDALANHFDAGDLMDWGMTARELELDLTMPDDGEEVSPKAKKEKKFEYKLLFNNGDELDQWYEFMAELKLSSDDEEYPTISQKIINYIKEHPIQI